MASTGEVRQGGPLSHARPEDTLHLGGLVNGDILTSDLKISDPVYPDVRQIEGRLGAACWQIWGTSASPARQLFPCPWSGTPKELARLHPGDAVHDVHYLCAPHPQPQLATAEDSPSTARGRFLLLGR